MLIAYPVGLTDVADSSADTNTYISSVERPRKDTYFFIEKNSIDWLILLSWTSDFEFCGLLLGSRQCRCIGQSSVNGIDIGIGILVRI